MTYKRRFHSDSIVEDAKSVGYLLLALVLLVLLILSAWAYYFGPCDLVTRFSAVSTMPARCLVIIKS